MSCCPSSGLYNITADQGATFSRVISWKTPAKKPIDITGYTGRMHVRKTIESEDTVLVLTTENGRISIAGPTGDVHLLVSSDDMTEIQEGLYVYDLEIIAPVSGTVERLVQGNFAIRAEVTR